MKKILIETVRKITRTIRGEISTDRLKKNGLRVGKNFSRQSGVRLDPSYPFLITIGDNVTLAPGVTVLAHDASLKNHLGITKTAPVIIEDNVFVGANAIILSGVKVGKASIIGAGAVVTKNVPEGEVWGGNPAKYIMTVEEYKEKTMKKCKESNTINGSVLKSYWLNSEGQNEKGMVAYQKCDNFHDKERDRNEYIKKYK